MRWCRRGPAGEPERRADVVGDTGDRVLDRLEQSSGDDRREAIVLVRADHRFARHARARQLRTISSVPRVEHQSPIRASRSSVVPSTALSTAGSTPRWSSSHRDRHPTVLRAVGVDIGGAVHALRHARRGSVAEALEEPTVRRVLDHLLAATLSDAPTIGHSRNMPRPVRRRCSTREQQRECARAPERVGDPRRWFGPGSGNPVVQAMPDCASMVGAYASRSRHVPSTPYPARAARSRPGCAPGGRPGRGRAARAPGG